MTFPASLAARPQYVLWRYETRGGRRTKVPYALDGRRASTTNPATWTKLAAVVLALTEHPRYDGIGFVFAPGDGFCGIDLDHVIDPHTGVIDEQALSIIHTLNSYTEYSPSRTGVHIYVRAVLPPDAVHKRGGIECYDVGRYFTVTASQFPGTPDHIADWDGAELGKLLFQYVISKRKVTLTPIRLAPPDPLSDREVYDLAAGAANGAKFRDLWQGGWGGHSSQSEADSALCWLLAFWTNGDVDQIDRLFRQSGLMREKWEKRPDYRARTIARAIERGDGYSRRAS